MVFAPSAEAGAGESVPTLVTTSEDGTVKVWANRPSDGAHVLAAGVWQCKFDLSYRSQPAYSSAISQDGSLLAVGHDSSLSLWDLSTGSLVKTLHIKDASVQGHIHSLAFLADGMSIVAATSSGSVVWDVITCEEITTIPNPVTSFAAHPARGTSTFATSTQSQINQYSLPSSSAAASPLPAQSLTFTHGMLGFIPAKIVNYTSPASASATSGSGQGQDNQIYAALSQEGQLYLTSSSSEALNASASNVAAGLESTNLSDFAATEAARSGGGGSVEGRPIRLFDDLFADND